MDNSFLVEEAYNQEKGVVQHIFNGFYNLNRQSDSNNEFYFLSFTQEWPVFSQTHQFSYTIPYTFVSRAGRSENGLGAVFLNYRYQAYLDPKTLTAFAPRASVILPTGERKLGLGGDDVGAQFNLPFSTTFGDYWFAHFNAGLTWLPGAGSAQNRDLIYYNLGASAIYAWKRDVHLMLEWVGYWTESGEPHRALEYQFTSLISPGIRKAFNFANESQLVIGVAAPMGLTGSRPDLGAFLYLSYEHFFSRAGQGEGAR
jgi:hypothetical protein